jgi:hypothetical protein
MMTSQVAVKLSIFLFMTRYAKIHLEIHLAQPVHRWNIPMAPQTINLRNHVRKMPELYKIRDKVDANPWHGDLPVKIGLFFLNLGVHWNHVFVAKKALLDFRKPGMLSTLDIWMAEAAVDLLHPGVNAVAEKDRLDRSQLLSRKQVIKI